MPKVTDRPVVVPVKVCTRVEYKVVYTCRDSEGDQVCGEDRFDHIAEAAMECDQILTYQGRFELPEDARVWWRLNDGAWQAWGGESR